MLRDAPPYIQGIVQRFGAEAVWQSGIEVLGFPPSWEPSIDDSLLILKHLNH
ncbi:MAG: hypothetical protein ACF788_01195 [Novipirellula sp. JB048]